MSSLSGSGVAMYPTSRSIGEGVAMNLMSLLFLALVPSMASVQTMEQMAGQATQAAVSDSARSMSWRQISNGDIEAAHWTMPNTRGPRQIQAELLTLPVQQAFVIQGRKVCGNTI